MTPGDAANPGAHTPIAVVWCRQVDNEAESPGYTTIPDDFAGRRETLEAIRVVGNLTVNVADTHDYWDPDPSQPLSYYPNLFLYPAAGGRYTCVGRMFLSTEDRPRIGMKTLVFDTAALVATGEFGAAVLRAHATMGGRTDSSKPTSEPDTQVYQGVGEGFLFHRGSTEPVVLVAGDHWEAVNAVALELVRTLPTSLVALGAFLVFPYFLPVAKVDMHQFTEQLPLALAVMRVPRAEAQGDRHAKRIQGWEAAPVSLRDITRPPSGRGKDALPLVLQYARDHTDEKLSEVSRRVDLVEGPRLRALLADADRQAGRDRRKEMWRIGTAMETAALLISRPRGRSIPLSGETGRRASEYVKARVEGEASSAGSVAAPLLESGPVSTTLPPWLQRPPDIDVPNSGSLSVPVSIQTDPSLFPSSSPEPSTGALTSDSSSTSGLPPPPPPPGSGPSNGAALDERIASAVRESDATWRATLDARLTEANQTGTRALYEVQTDLASRLAVLEARPPPPPPDEVAGEVERRIRSNADPRFAELSDKIQQTVKAAGEVWASALRQELKQWAEELTARSAHTEEELRAALVAQLELEVSEAKEQNSALREQIEARVRSLIDGRFAELDQRRARDARELEQKVGILVEGRAKVVEQRIGANVDTRGKEIEGRLAGQVLTARTQLDERLAQSTKRLEIDREARLAQVSETQSKSLAGLQVRMQSYLDQKIREDQERERGKYVELLARLKAEVDEALARTIDSTRFDAAVRERVTRAVGESRAEHNRNLVDLENRMRTDQGSSITRLESVEAKIRERETDLGKTEEKVRHDVEDLDRRIQVMSDRMLPLVRKTWVRIEELEKTVSSGLGSATLTDLRRDLARELRRMETELRDEQAELRERLESTVTSQGKIWLNLVRQMAEAGTGYVPSEEEVRRASGRRTGRRPSGGSDDPDLDLLGRPRNREAPYAAFDEDPANPLDPHLPSEDRTPARRPAPRTGRGGGSQS
ncbi:MAG: hypothetical protein L3K10_05870 [Thermoplasmata archaeon]|nr:hypothetical protein [Thermoplasmata archaeon]